MCQFYRRTFVPHIRESQPAADCRRNWSGLVRKIAKFAASWQANASLIKLSYIPHATGSPCRYIVHAALLCPSYTRRARLCRWSGLVVSFLNSTTRTRPDQTHGPLGSPTSPPTGLVVDLSAHLDMYGLRPWVWSGRVADKVRWSVWWNLETTRPDPTSDEVWSGPHSGIWTSAHSTTRQA